MVRDTVKPDFAAADGVVAASQVYHWEIALQSLVDDIGNGKLGGNTYEINLENEGLVIEWGNWDVPSALTDLLDQVSESVINGEVTTIIPKINYRGEPNGSF